MRYSEWKNLAIVACPGGEKFADETIHHLKRIYAKNFEKRVENISKYYGVEEKSVVRDFNFFSDLTDARLRKSANRNQFFMPRFKVDARFTYFTNGEFKTEINECIRGRDVFIFQDVENHRPITVNGGQSKQVFSVNDHLMSLIVTIDAVRHAGAERIILVLPVYPYSRQHKKKGREGLTASLLGQLYENLGVNQIITLDIHSREIENAFNCCRIDNLHASFQIIRELTRLVDFSDPNLPFTVVAPDSGAIDRNKFYSAGLKKPLAMIYKERDYTVVTQNAKQSNIISVNLLGDVKDKIAFLADDMLGTGGTLLKAMEFLTEQGAKKIIAAISLPFFTGDAINQFDEAYKKGYFFRIIGTNAVYHDELLKRKWYIKTDVSALFAQVIYRIHHNLSLSDLLDNRNIIEKLLNPSNSAKNVKE